MIIFVPVIEGDAGHYISLAKSIAYSDKPVELGNRSPLYPWLLALLVKISGESSLPGTVRVIQYVLVFLSSLFIYRLVETVTSEQIIAFLTGFLYLISISTINYGYLILTETLTLFLFILSSWLLIYYYKASKNILLIFSGLSFSALILARYNTFLLPLFAIIAIMLYDYISNSESFILKFTIKRILLFSVPIIIVLTAWSCHNYIKYDYFFLFSIDKEGIFVSRNGIYASINSSTEVSDEFMPFKEVVLGVQNDFIDRSFENRKKGSLLRFLPSKKYIIYNNGGSIRSQSYNRFKEYFGSEINTEENLLIKEFENEAHKNNRSDIFKLRIFSLLTGLRASSSSLGMQYRNININVLPPSVFIAYKLIVILMTIIAYFHMAYMFFSFLIRKSNSMNYGLILLLLTVYFPFINFVFAIADNANRFKFPSEPFIIMFALLGIISSIKYFKRKFLQSQTSLET